MNHTTKFLILLCFVFHLAQADVYGHNMRFSNNRLNGRGQNRDNANRLFDSQNNDKGGYVVGPQMFYYAGSMLPIEWTNQHSCANDKTGRSNCQIILQYMCEDGDEQVRDGTVTTTIPDDPQTYDDRVIRNNPWTGDEEVVYVYGMHESYQYYQDCKTRERNKGLFTADQNLNNRNAAIYTRQDNNGTRYGFECPEERDYYPYWHPTPWKDIGILVSNTDRCEYYKRESQNNKAKNYCSKMQFNNEAACKANNGKWKSEDPWDLDADYECVQMPWTRDNHLGNTKTGFPAYFNWTIPEDYHENCVVRIRYNVTTDDYDGWDSEMDARFNGDLSPVQQDPDVMISGFNLTLALNTDQTGRTFEDRSHTFEIRKRPMNIPPNARIYNLNVRGKRGNIVQVYPAVEYDFVPNYLHVRVGDYIHFQWTGGDTNPNNNDGEGTNGTDRSNIVDMIDNNLGANYPEDESKPYLIPDAKDRLRFAYLDQEKIKGANKRCLSLQELREKNNNNQNAIEQDVQNCAKLNAASPYFNGGVQKMKNTGTYNYVCTRNNNFSNRSQKGVIVVEDMLPTWSVFVIMAGAAVFVVSTLVGFAVMFAKQNQDSQVGRALLGINNKLTTY